MWAILKHKHSKQQWIKLALGFQYRFHLSFQQIHFTGNKIRKFFSEHFQPLLRIWGSPHSIHTTELISPLLRLYFTLLVSNASPLSFKNILCEEETEHEAGRGSTLSTRGFKEAHHLIFFHCSWIKNQFVEMSYFGLKFKINLECKFIMMVTFYVLSSNRGKMLEEQLS